MNQSRYQENLELYGIAIDKSTQGTGGGVVISYRVAINDSTLPPVQEGAALGHHLGHGHLELGALLGQLDDLLVQQVPLPSLGIE